MKKLNIFKSKSCAQFKIFFKTPVRIIALVLSIALVFNTLSMVDFSVFFKTSAASRVYNTPTEKLSTLDAGTKNKDIYNFMSWYTGFYNDVLLDRYVGYTQSGGVLTNLGSEAEPYIIKTGLELSYLAALCNGNTISDPTFSGKHIMMEGSVDNELQQSENVIDLILAGGYLYQKEDQPQNFSVDYNNNAYPSWLGWVDCTESNNNFHGWTPIGISAAKSFNGHIYAADATNGIKVYNMNYSNGGNTAEKSTWKSNFEYVGLFGYLGPNAVVEGINIVDAQVFTRGSTYVGTLAGGMDVSAKIKNSTSSGLDCESTGVEKSVRTKNALGNNVWSEGYTVPDFTVLMQETQKASVAGGLVGTIVGTIPSDLDTITFSGLTVKNTVMRSSDKYIGGVVGSTKVLGVSKTLQLTSPSFSGKLISSSSTGSGGILGFNDASNAKLHINDAKVQGPFVNNGEGIYTDNPLLIDLTSSITAGDDSTQSKSGGIVGYSTSTSELRVENVQNIALKFYTGSDPTYNKGMSQVGGIIGHSADKSLVINGVGVPVGSTGYSDSNRPLHMTVEGRVKTDNGNANVYGGVGGIAGFLLNSAAQSKTIMGCYTTVDGKVATSNGYNNIYFGGIVGRVRAGVGANNATATGVLQLQNCYSVNSRLSRITSYTNNATTLITVGGIVGAVNGMAASGSFIKNCVVQNLSVACDGLLGGIMGISSFNVGGNLNIFEDCTVKGLTQNISTTNYSEINSIKTAGITPHLSGGGIKNCVIEDMSVTYLTEAYGANINNHLPYIGGIAAQVDSQGVIENCVANIKVRAGNTKTSSRPLLSGGIVAYLGRNGGFAVTDRASVSQSIGIIDFQDINSATIAASYSYNEGALTENPPEIANMLTSQGAYAVGGIAAYSSNNNVSALNTITDCFSSGNIEINNESDKTNIIGGILAWSDTATNISNSFSTCSLYGQVQDAIGGLVGTNKYNLSVTNASYGGFQRNPFMGAIAGYATTNAVYGAADNYLKYNRITAPGTAITKASGTLGILAEDKASISYPIDAAGVSAWSSSAAVSSLQLDYYDSATKNLTIFDNNNAENHVFSVLDRDIFVGRGSTAGIDSDIKLYKNDGSEILPNGDNSYSILNAPSAEDRVTTSTVAFSVKVNNASPIIRKALFISRIYGHDDENGKINTETSFDGTHVFGASDSLALLQEHTAAGGAFTGSKFKLNSDYTETYVKPIGSINSNLKSTRPDDNPFCGSIDGNGRTLTVYNGATSQSSDSVEGLFGYTFCADIKNINIVYPAATSFAATYSGGAVGYAEFSNISGVNVTAASGLDFSSASGGSYSGGIIGYSLSTPISNTSFVGSITGKSNVGGIIGYANRSSKNISAWRWQINLAGSASNSEMGISAIAPAVKDCYVTGDILSSSSPVGGLIGYAAGSVAGQIESSFMFGNVEGQKYVGGLVGQLSNANSRGIILKSYMRGNVTASIEYAGGLVGYTSSPSPENVYTIQGAYFAGQIKCDGLIGAAAGNFVCASDFYFDAQLAGDLDVFGTVEGNAGSALTTVEMGSLNIAGFIAGNKSGVFGGSYPTLTNFSGDAIGSISVAMEYDFGTNRANNAYALQKALDVKILPPTNGINLLKTGSIVKLDGSTTNAISDIGVTSTTSPIGYANTKGVGGSFKTTATYNSALLRGYTLKIDTLIVATPFDGEGTEAAPYKIPNVEMLVKFREYINNIFCGEGQHFKLTMGEENADYNLADYVYDLSDERQNPGGNWNTVIGLPNMPFTGHFDGNGKLITNLNITAPSYGAYDGKNYYTSGLFGFVFGAIIENITLEGAVDISQTNGTFTYLGMLSGWTFNSSFNKITLRSSGKSIADEVPGFSYNKDLNKISFNLGANGSTKRLGTIASYATGSTNLSDILIESNKISFIQTQGTNDTSLAVGGAIGYAYASRNETITFDRVIVYTNLINETDASLAKANTIGGIAGCVEGNTAENTIKITNSAVFGSIINTVGSTGGIAGTSKTAPVATSVIKMENISVTADILSGNKNAENITARIGGIFGTVTQNGGSNNLSNCVFGGTINFERPTKYTEKTVLHIGGLIGDGKLSDVNDVYVKCYFDKSKNYDLFSSGLEKLTDDRAEDTYVLLDSDYRYLYPDITAANYASSANNEIANKIVLGQSIALGIVRTSSVLGYSSVTPKVSSVYVRNARAALSGDKGDNTLFSAQNKRIVSTNTNTVASVTVRVTIDTGAGGDGLSGYGKTYTFYPSIEDTGRRDASYIIANPSGDSIETDNSFTIYNFDQLYGIAAILSGKTSGAGVADDSGGFIDANVFGDSTKNLGLSGKTIRLGKDIAFDNTNYINQTAYDSVIIAPTKDMAFEGVLDGAYHTISKHNKIITDPNVLAIGLFGYTSGATIKNVGITDSVVSYKSKSNSGVKIGGIVGSASDTEFTRVFSSARVEQSEISAKNVMIGGFAGEISGTSAVKYSYFTGTVGITASQSGSYSRFASTENFYSGGFAGGVSSGTTEFLSSYLAAYIYGDMSQTGSIAGNNTGIIKISNTYVDDNTTSGSLAIGTGSSSNGSAIILHETLANQTIAGFTSTLNDGLYPIIDGFANELTKTKQVVCSVIPASFSNSAASLSRAELSYASAETSTKFVSSELNSVYDGVVTIVNYPYILTNESTLIRNYNGLASVIIEHNGAARIIMMNLECWYDNYVIENNKKVYTIKTLSEFLEFANLIKYGDVEADIGHGHSSDKHKPDDKIDATFANAVVKLGADIVFNNYAQGEDVYYIEPAAATPETSFKGEFDGNGYTFVSPAFTAKANADPSVGLFGYISDEGRIHNVAVGGTAIVAISTDNAKAITGGMIAGTNNGIIENSFNSAQVKVVNYSNTALAFGGIVGTNNATVRYVYNMGHISAHSEGMIIAGIAGINNLSILAAYNTGIITGYLDKAVLEYQCQTVIAGIFGSGGGNADSCYNAAIIENYKNDAYHPIANSGSVTNCYFDGQHFIRNYVFNDAMNNTVYSQGTSILSTKQLSGGTLPSAFSQMIWNGVSGYYPMFVANTGSANDNERQASAASAVAAVLTSDETIATAFDNYNLITLYNYKQLVGLKYSLTSENNQGTFFDKTSASSINAIFEAAKKGTAIIKIYCAYGDGNVASAIFVRECAFSGEETYELGYKVDFSNLIASKGETTLRKNQVDQNVNTFLLNGDYTVAAATAVYGNGTAGKPYLINTADDLDRCALYVNNSENGAANKYFMLTRDIAYPQSRAWTPIGTPNSDLSKGIFRGKFIGNGYSISGIKVVATGLKYIGLFGYTESESSIRLLALEDCVFSMPIAPQDGHSGYKGDIYIGAIAAYSRGSINNCYSRSTVETYTISAGNVYAGGLVGMVDGGNLMACYARPLGQVVEINFTPTNTNNFCSYTQNRTGVNYYAGILVGYNKGNVRSVYHTAIYFTPSTYNNLAMQGILIGYNEGGTIKNSTYNTTFLPTGELKLYNDINGGLAVGNGIITGMSTAKMRDTETAGVSSDGTANDGAAIALSRGIYLGTYQSALMTPHDAILADPDYQNNKPNNDGFPMLMAFDLLQYEFASFDTSNILISMYNIDSSESKLMNILSSYENYDFPVLASVVAKDKMKVNLHSLPSNLSYNVSSVAYGRQTVTLEDESIRTDDIKWTIMDGVYTKANNLSVGEGSQGKDMLQSINGSINVITSNLDSTNQIMPENADRIYVYISILPETEYTGNLWGISHSWDSATLQEILDNAAE